MKGARFSRFEFKELLKVWIIVSIAFAILLSGFKSMHSFILMFAMAALTVGVGILFHELAHKIIAQRYGCWAEFRASNKMLILTLVTSLFGFLFVAPGAVMIAGNINKEKNGKISIAGPFTNAVIALVFFMIFAVTKSQLASFGFSINSWLALFNIIPFGIFDGAKILAWNKKVYGLFALAVILMFVLPYFV